MSLICPNIVSSDQTNDESVLTLQIKSNAQQMSKYNRYSFLLWENEPLNETFNPLWLPMAPYEIYPDIKYHLNHFLVPTPHITGRRGWGTHVILSLCYWFILCSLLSGGNPPITPAIVARYNVIILLSDHIGLLHFMDRKFGAVWWKFIVWKISLNECSHGFPCQCPWIWDLDNFWSWDYTTFSCQKTLF